MKYQLTFALVASLTSTAFAAFQAPLPEFKNEKQLAEWRAEKASEATKQGYANEETAFYTGKPYLASSGGYAFKYRSYSPELARWTSEDPSGFPDGANTSAYAPIPTSQLDLEGLLAIDSSVVQVPEVRTFSGIQVNTLRCQAKTTVGNYITVYKFLSLKGDEPPTGGPFDFTQNCHGFVFLPGYWIDSTSVPIILADEHKETSEQNAKIVVYGGDDHSANVLSFKIDGTIDKVQSKNGYLLPVINDLSAAWPSTPKFYE